MFDIGWSEIAIVAVAALIFVGPKDLPRALKTMGQWVGKIRSLTREFQSAIDDMVRESELEDVKNDINSLRSFDIKKKIEETIDENGELDDVFAEDWEDDDIPNKPTDTAAEPAPGDADLDAADDVDAAEPAPAKREETLS